MASSGSGAPMVRMSAPVQNDEPVPVSTTT
jgi:hypothetical protein